MSDPHAALKEDYWDVKYREWRWILIALLFILPLITGLLVFYFTSRSFAALPSPNALKTLSQEPPRPSLIEQPSSQNSPTAGQPPKRSRVHIKTDIEECQQEARLKRTIPANAFFFLPANCDIHLLTNDDALVVLTDLSEDASVIFLLPQRPIGLMSMKKNTPILVTYDNPITLAVAYRPRQK